MRNKLVVGCWFETADWCLDGRSCIRSSWSSSANILDIVCPECILCGVECNVILVKDDGVPWGAGPPGFSCRPYLQRNWDKRGCATKKNCAVIYRDEPKAKQKKIVMGWGGGSQDLQHLSDQETRGTDKSCCSAQGQRSQQMPGRRQHMIGALRRPLRRGLGRGGTISCDPGRRRRYADPLMWTNCLAVVCWLSRSLWAADSMWCEHLKRSSDDDAPSEDEHLLPRGRGSGRSDVWEAWPPQAAETWLISCNTLDVIWPHHCTPVLRHLPALAQRWPGAVVGLKELSKQEQSTH